MLPAKITLTKLENKKEESLFSMKNKNFQQLQGFAALQFGEFLGALKDVREKFPLPANERWEWDDENFKFRRVKLPDMEWLPFEEPNEELS